MGWLSSAFSKAKAVSANAGSSNSPFRRQNPRSFISGILAEVESEYCKAFNISLVIMPMVTIIGTISRQEHPAQIAGVICWGFSKKVLWYFGA